MIFASVVVTAPGWALRAPTDQPQHVVVVDPLTSAQSLIDRGDIAAARTILDAISQLPEEDRNGLDPDWIAFLRAQIAFHEGRWSEAIVSYRRLLSEAPRNTRVRLELGRALFALRKDREAEKQFERALAGDDLPIPAIDNVERFLFQIEDRKVWRSRFAVSIVPDTNINQATDAQTVDLFGLPFVLNEAGQEKSGLGVSGSAGIEYRPRLSRKFRLLTALNAQRVEFGGESFDDTIVAGSVGIEIGSAIRQLRIEARSFRRWFGTPGFNRGAGGQITYLRRLSRRAYMQLALAGQYIDFDQDSSRDGPVLTAQLLPIYVIDPATQISALLGISREFARFLFQRNTGYRFGMGIERDLPWGLSISSRPEINWRRFAAIHPAFGAKRKDFIIDFSIDVMKRDRRILGLVPFVGYSLTHNASNIEFFKFTRHRFRFGLRRRF